MQIHFTASCNFRRISSFLLHIDKLHLFLIVLSACILAFWISAPMDGSHQHELFFRSGDDFFMDYYNPIRMTKAKNIYTGDGEALPKYGVLSFAERCYPPLGYLPHVFVNRIISTYRDGNVLAWVLGFLGFTICTTIFSYLLGYRLHANHKTKLWFVVSILMSGIFMFSFERGNITLVASLLSSFYIFFYRSKDRILKELALIALALSAGMKYAPAILGCLCLCEKDWKAAMRLYIYGVLAFLLPFFCFENNILNIRVMLENTKYASECYFTGNGRCFFVGYGSILKFMFSLSELQCAYIFYAISMILGIISLVLSFYEKMEWRRTFLLAFIVVLFPFTTKFYMFLYFFPCFVLFFNSDSHSKLDYFFAFVLAIFCSPLQIYVGKYNIFWYLNSISADLMLLIVIFESFRDNILPRIRKRKKLIEDTVIAPCV